MIARAGQIKSELTMAESVLHDAEGQLREINQLLEEKWSERRAIARRIDAAGAAGEVDALLGLQARAMALDRGLSELGRSGAQCLKRIESARKYVSSLNERLETLKDEAEQLAARIERRTKSLTAPLKLSRVKVRIAAIKGDD